MLIPALGHAALSGGSPASRDVALAAALVAALGYGSASVLQALAARRADPGAVLRHPWYVAGTGVDVLAWLVSLVALRTLPVYEVQAVLASSVAVTAILAQLTLGVSLHCRDVVALAISMSGLALLATASAPPRGASGSSWEWFVLAAAPVVAALGIAAARTPKPAAAAALLAGIAYGGAAICAQQLPLSSPLWRLHTLTTLLSSPLAYAFVLYAVTGMWLYAVALEHGRVGPATALLWIGEVLAPTAAAAVLLHEYFRTGCAAAGILGLAAILAAAIVLSAVEPGVRAVPAT